MPTSSPKTAAETVQGAEAALAEVIELKDLRRTDVQDAERRVSELMDRAELDRLLGQQTELVDVRVRIAAAGTILDRIKVDDALVAALEDARAAVVEARAALAAGVPEVVGTAAWRGAGRVVGDRAGRRGAVRAGLRRCGHRVGLR